MLDKDIQKNLNYYIDYFEAMFWADINGSEDFSDCCEISDINKECLVRQIEQLDKFFELADEILEKTDYTHEQACHDFYFTRCGHGVGFWENDHCEEKEGQLLTEIAEKFGNVDIYLGDDKKVYIS